MGEESKDFVIADAPVSGGVPGAEKGTLTFMVGVDTAHYEVVKSFLKPIYQWHYHSQ